MGEVTAGARLVVRIAGVRIAAHDRPAIGQQTRVGEALPHEVLDLHFLERRAVARAFPNQFEGRRAHLVHPAPRLQMRFQRRRSPARFEDLDQFGGRHHLHAQAAHQFHRAGVHNRHVGHRAHRRIRHRHALHPRRQLAQRRHLLRPAGVSDLLPRQARQLIALDAVLHALRLALRGNHVIPSPRRTLPRRQPEDPVCQRIPQVVIEEEPPVQLLFAKFLLNFSEIHVVIPVVFPAAALKRLSKSSWGTPSISTTFSRLVKPVTMRTRDRGTPANSAKIPHALVVRLAIHRRRRQSRASTPRPPGPPARSAWRADAPLP